MKTIDQETLMRYLDGEITPSEAARIEAELATSTELQREVTLFRALKEDLQQLTFDPRVLAPSVWQRVHARLTRPLGWLLMVVGAVVWVAYGTWMYTRSSIALWEKMATGAVVLLKGPTTLVARHGDGHVWASTTGDARLATAGTGDVLTGLLAALLAQGLPADEAAASAAYLHGRAGALAWRRGLVAGDVVDHLPLALSELSGG